MIDDIPVIVIVFSCSQDCPEKSLFVVSSEWQLTKARASETMRLKKVCTRALSYSQLVCFNNFANFLRKKMRPHVVIVDIFTFQETAIT
jgi:hypothetical protein